MGWTTRLRFPVGAGKGFLSLLPTFQTGFGGHPVSYPMLTGGTFPGGKVAGA